VKHCGWAPAPDELGLIAELDSAARETSLDQMRLDDGSALLILRFEFGKEKHGRDVRVHPHPTSEVEVAMWRIALLTEAVAYLRKRRDMPLRGAPR
jgi:hypothetical protein